MSQTQIGIYLIVAAFVLHFLRKFRGLSAGMVFVGVILTGVGHGFLGSLLSRAAAAIESFAGTAGQWAFGLSTAGILTLILAIVVVHDLHPRNSAKPNTFWWALLLAAIISAGAAGLPLFDHIDTVVKQGVTTIQGG